MRTLIVALGLLVCSSAQAQYQKNWKPNRYRVHCANSVCLSQDLHKLIEKFLRQAAMHYRDKGWRMVANFGPVIGMGKDGYVGANAHVRVYDKTQTKQGIAASVGVCLSGVPSTMEFGADTAKYAKPTSGAAKPYFVAFATAHELFHLIQQAYSPFSDCKPSGGWVREGTANAVATAFTRPSWPHPTRQSVRELRTSAGIRRYDEPLNKIEYNSAGVEDYTGSKIYYYTSSFWRHLAEVYHGGKYEYLQLHFARKPFRQDWLAWLHDNVKGDPKIKAALGPVYARFVADYAGWYGPNQPGGHFNEKSWLNTTFGGCTKIELDPKTQPEFQLNMALKRTAAKCVKVRVKGVSAGQRISVKVGALRRTGAPQQADQIHLSLAGSTDSTKFRCATAIRSKDPKKRVEGLHRCLFLPYTGKTTIGSAKRSARIWDVIPQEIETGGGFENTYLVSRVSTTPKRKPPKKDGADFMKFSMVFVVETSEMKVVGSAPSIYGPQRLIRGRNQKQRVVGHLNTEATNNAQEQVPKHNARGGQAMPIIYPHAPRVSMPKIPIELRSKQGNKGIWMLRFTRVGVESDGLYQESLRDGDSIAVFPVTGNKNGAPRPLQIGDKGTFKAALTGRLANMGVFSEKPGTLVVEKFTPYVLQARVSGTLCLAVKKTRRNPCPHPRRFSARIVKGFAGLHMPGARFVIEDTPGTQQYRQMLSSLMAQAYQSRGGAPPAGGSPSKASPITGPYSSKVYRVGKCECTCNDRYYLDQLDKDLRSGKQKESPAMLRQVMKMGGCMRACTRIYIGQCKKQKKLKPRR